MKIRHLEQRPDLDLAGVRVTVNTDDPFIFGATLSEEFLALYEAGVMTARELDFIRASAFD